MLASGPLELVDSAVLHSELKRLLTVCAASIADAALVYSELKSRGEDVSYVSSAISRTLDLVSSGSLDPEAALAFGRSKAKTELVSRLPTDMQRRLARGERIRVVDVAGRRVKESTAAHLSASDLATAIGGGRLLSTTEQTARLAQSISTTEAMERSRSLTIRLPESLFNAAMRAADARGLSIYGFITTCISDALSAASSRGVEA